MLCDRKFDLGASTTDALGAVALTGFTTAAKKGVAVDLGAAGYDSFGGSKAPTLPEGWGLNLECDVSMNAAATITFYLYTSTLEALTGGTTTLLGQLAKSAVTLTAGQYIGFIPIDQNAVMQRYIGMFVSSDVSLSTFSARAWFGPKAETPVSPTNKKL